MTLKARVKRSVQRLWRRRADRRAVQEFSRSLALIADPAALEASVAARIQELFDPDRLVIWQLDRERGALRPGFSAGLPRAEVEGLEIKARGRLARWLLVNETCLALPRDQGVYEYLDPLERAIFDHLEVRLAAPLLALNHLIGIVFLGSDRPDWVVTQNDAELLLHLANQASLAFHNAALYREQRERLDRLHRAERLAAVGQLAAGVAHEIRNPLTAIRSTMQYLLSGIGEGDARRELVRDLVGEVDRIEGTISGLLSLTRAGEFRPAEIDPAEPLEHSLRLVEAQAKKQGVEVARRFEAGPLRVEGDADQLKQVYLNLLLNALQAMPEGGRLTVATRPTQLAAPPRAGVEIAVADTGGGIPEEQLRRVFDPFFTTKKEGTGLGLAICHGIMERHGGEIQLESRVGEGTVARLRLPVKAQRGGPWPES